MKRLAICILLISAATLCVSQEDKAKKTTPAATSAAAPANASAVEEAIKKNEHSLWEAWKNHNNKPFEEMMAEDSIMLDDPSSGFMDKKTMVSKMSDPSMQCDVKSYSFENEHVTWIDKDAAILHYSANVDAACGGEKLPEKVHAASVWAKRGGKWMAVSHQETFVSPMTPAEKK
jgi:uncharacterized protein (TIGR02246 family)